jgi:hypothetical protein
VKITGDTMVSSSTDNTTALLTLTKANTISWPAAMKMLVLKGANNREFSFKFSNSGTNVDIGYDWAAGHGSGAAFRSTDSDGSFIFFARKTVNSTKIQT